MGDIIDINKYKNDNKGSTNKNGPFSMLDYFEWFRRFAWFNNPFVSVDSKLLKNIDEYDKEQLKRLDFFYNGLVRIAKERNLFFQNEYDDYLYIELQTGEIKLSYKICRKQNEGLGTVYFVNAESLNNKSIKMDMLYNEAMLNDVISIQSYLKSQAKEASENHSK